MIRRIRNRTQSGVGGGGGGCPRLLPDLRLVGRTRVEEKHFCPPDRGKIAKPDFNGLCFEWNRTKTGARFEELILLSRWRGG